MTTDAEREQIQQGGYDAAYVGGNVLVVRGDPDPSINEEAGEILRIQQDDVEEGFQGVTPQYQAGNLAVSAGENDKPGRRGRNKSSGKDKERRRRGTSQASRSGGSRSHHGKHRKRRYGSTSRPARKSSPEHSKHRKGSESRHHGRKGSSDPARSKSPGRGEDDRSAGNNAHGRRRGKDKDSSGSRRKKSNAPTPVVVTEKPFDSLADIVGKTSPKKRCGRGKDGAVASPRKRPLDPFVEKAMGRSTAASSDEKKAAGDTVVRLLTREAFTLVQVIERVEPIAEYEDLGASLVDVMQARASVYQDEIKGFLDFLAARECKDNPADPTQAFAGSSLAQRVVVSYLALTAQVYLRKALSQPLQEAIGAHHVEIDPSHYPPALRSDRKHVEKTVRANSQRLQALADRVLDSLLGMLDRLPEPCSAVLLSLKSTYTKSFGHEAWKAFLPQLIIQRLICPIVMRPSPQGVLSAPPQEAGQRVLLLVSKLLGLAAQAPNAHIKESYMRINTEWATSARAKVDKLLAAITDRSRKWAQPSHKVGSSERQDAMNHLFAVINDHVHMILEVYRRDFPNSKYTAPSTVLELIGAFDVLECVPQRRRRMLAV